MIESSYRLSTLHCGWYPDYLMRRQAKIGLAIAVWFVFLVLRRGAAYCGIPPLYGGEIVIIIMALFFARFEVIRQFLRNPFGMACALYVLMVMPYVAIAYGEAGFLSFELSAVAYYAVFIFFGYAAIGSFQEQAWFIRCFYWAIIISDIHLLVSLVYPLDSVGPTVNGVSLLGHGDSSYIYFSVGLAYACIFAYRLGVVRTTLLVCLSIAGYLTSMERGALLGILGVCLILFVYRRLWYRRLSVKVVGILAGLSLAFAILLLTDIDTPFLTKAREQGELVKTVFGTSEVLEHKAGTRAHRLQMWQSVIQATAEKDVIFGQGLGDRLVDVAFKNPHNSFISIFGFFGIVGISLAVTIYMGIPIALLRLSTKLRRRQEQDIVVFYLCCVCGFYSAAFFGPTLVSPFSALVWNFIYGAMLRYTELLKQSNLAGGGWMARPTV
jgi:hypothetical protein